jgi:hypothetical protein
VFITEEE